MVNHLPNNKLLLGILGGLHLSKNTYSHWTGHWCSAEHRKAHCSITVYELFSGDSCSELLLSWTRCLYYDNNNTWTQKENVVRVLLASVSSNWLKVNQWRIFRMCRATKQKSVSLKVIYIIFNYSDQKKSRPANLNI